MTRKLFSVLIAICIVIGVLPFTAIAVDAEATYTTSTGSAEEGSFLEAIASVADGGTITLLKNIEVNGTVTSPISKSFTLLGGGYEINLTNCTLTLAGNTELRLGAEGYEHTLKLYSTDDTRAIMSLSDSAKLHMYDGVTLGPSTAAGTVGGIHLMNYAEFHMHGGLITDCISLFATSGAVTLRDYSAFYMSGGRIQNCSGMEGGAICMHPSNPIGGLHSTGTPTFEMTGGTISNCHDVYYGGGAIYSYAGSQGLNIEITGGRIENCIVWRRAISESAKQG